MTRFVQILRNERSNSMKTMKLYSVIGAMASLSLCAMAQSGTPTIESSTTLNRASSIAGTTDVVFHEADGTKNGSARQSDAKNLPCIHLAKDLIGMKVVNPQGQNVGKIEDIVVRPSGEVAYAVLSFGGVMGLGDKLFAMPWSVLTSRVAGATKAEESDALPSVNNDIHVGV